jgi:hypothetical protein
MFKLLVKKDKSCCFIVTDLHVSLINSLRRIILSDINFSGIDQKNVTIIKNTTHYTDEIIAHRISLIPINTVERNCTYHLNVINTNSDSLYVTSNHFKNFSTPCDFFQNIIICPLRKEQEIQLVVTSDKKTCKVGGISYRPISTAYFRPIVFVYIKNGKSPEKIIQYFDKCDIDLHTNIKHEKKGYQCMGFTTNINHVDIKLDGNSLFQENNLNIYAFMIDYFFENTVPSLLIKQSIDIFLQTMCKGLIGSSIKCTHVNETEIILHFDYDQLTETILNPFAYFLRQHKKVLFAQYNKKIDDSCVIDLHITLNKQYSLCSLKEIINETIITITTEFNSE